MISDLRHELKSIGARSRSRAEIAHGGDEGPEQKLASNVDSERNPGPRKVPLPRLELLRPDLRSWIETLGSRLQPRAGLTHAPGAGPEPQPGTNDADDCKPHAEPETSSRLAPT